MRLVAALIVIAAVVVVLAFAWYLLNKYLRHRARRADRIERLDQAMLKVQQALDNYEPGDIPGENLANDMRLQLVRYHEGQRVHSARKRLQSAEQARADIARLLSLSPPHLFRPDDESSRTFLKAAFGALHHRDEERYST